MTVLHKQIQEDPAFERKPSLATLKTWRVLDNWELKAEVLDGKASIVVDQRAIDERAQMLEEHSQAGAELRKKGVKYVQDHEPENFQDAIRAIVQGSTLERQSRGLMGVLTKIASADNDELNSMLRQYLGAGDNVIEAEAKDAPTEENTDTERPDTE